MVSFLRFHFSKAVLLGILFFTFTMASGQSVWTNPIEATNPSTQNPYTTGDVKDANITVSGIGRGSGIAGNAGTGRYNATGWTTSGSSNADDYFYFTLAPTSGHKINFVSLVFNLQRSNTGPATFALRSSLDNYTSTIELIAVSGSTLEKTVALSGASFQNVASSITFRLYGYDADSSSGTASINDFTFNGVTSTLGLEDHVPVKPGFRVFPNPTEKGIVHFNLPADIEVYDSLGKLLISQKETTSLDTTGFVSGIYFIRTAGGTQRLVVK